MVLRIPTGLIGATLVAALLCAPHSAARAQAPDVTQAEVTEMTLAAAVGLALRNNRTIKIAQVAREAQKFTLRLRESLFDPQLSLTSSTTLTRTKQQANEISSVANQLNAAAAFTPKATWQSKLGTSVSLTLNTALDHTVDRAAGGTETKTYTIDPELSIVQPLLKGFGRGVNTANLEIARLNAKLGQLQMRNTVAQIITAVVREYWQVVLNKERQRIARLALDRAQQVLKTNRDLVTAGRMASLEVVQAEADVAQKEYDLDVAQNNYLESQNNLLNLLALPENISFSPSAPTEAEKVDIPFALAESYAKANRFEIIQNKVEKALAEVAVTVAEDGMRWELNLTGAAGSNSTRRYIRDAIRGVGHEANTLSVGLEFVVPLTDLTPESELVTAKGSLQTAQLNLDEAYQTVRLDTENAVRNAKANYRQLQLARNATALAARQLEVELEKLAVGRSSNFQVLSYQDTLRTSQLNEVQAHINYLTALANLDFALGTTLQTWHVETTDEAAYLTEATPASLNDLTAPPGQRDQSVTPPPID